MGEFPRMTPMHSSHRVRLISLAGQRFIAEVIHDALQLSKARLSSASRPNLRKAGLATRRVLTPDDLSKALKDIGVSLHKPLYFVDN
jgi:transcription initiation factor TFIID subunit 10